MSISELFQPNPYNIFVDTISISDTFDLITGCHGAIILPNSYRLQGLRIGNTIFINIINIGGIFPSTANDFIILDTPIPTRFRFNHIGVPEYFGSCFLVANGMFRLSVFQIDSSGIIAFYASPNLDQFNALQDC